MFETVLKEMIGFFDKRFVSTVFLPCLVFCLTFTALVCYAEGVDRTLGLWNAQPIEIQAFLIILYLALVYLLAYMILTFIGPIIRVYEGYPGWVKWLLKSRTEYYRKNLETMCKCWIALEGDLSNLAVERDGKARALDEALGEVNRLKAENVPDTDPRMGKPNEKYWGLKKEIDVLDRKIQRRQLKQSAIDNEKHFYYPPCINHDSVLPTRLGNILKSAEYYPQSRYNLDSVLIWPRLYPVLPDGFKDMLAEKKSSLDTLITISILSVVFALAGTGYFLLLRHSWPLFLLTFCGGLILWLLSYKSAVEVTMGYGALIKVGYDLYRGDLLKALRLKMPATLVKEKELWHELCQYIYYGDEMDFQYAVPCPPQPGEKDKED